MSTVSYLSDLYRYFTLDVKGATQPVMLLALQEGARRFLGDTEVWQEWLEPENLVSEQSEYLLDWEYCSEIRRIKEVRTNTEDGVTEGNTGVLMDPKGYEFDQPETFTFNDNYIPDTSVTNGLDIKVVFVPLLRTCDLPEWVLNRYVDGIMAAAKMYLFDMERVKWSSQSKQAMWRSNYRREKHLAKQETGRANKDATQYMGA